ncbi:MAG TPA: hypothetical protein VF090_05705, partial [Methyloceanibacter sp.]
MPRHLVISPCRGLLCCDATQANWLQALMTRYRLAENRRSIGQALKKFMLFAPVQAFPSILMADPLESAL